MVVGQRKTHLTKVGFPTTDFRDVIVAAKKRCYQKLILVIS